MKQTLEKAAREYADGFEKIVPGQDDNIQSARIVGFKRGAQWQAKQSPWISVEKEEPIINEPILAILDGRVVVIILDGWDNRQDCHPRITHWMPIPE